MSDQDSERLREHPEQRFSAPQHQFDLDTVAVKLRQEAQSGPAGHRQETLYKHGLSSVALFLFGRQSRLPQHRTSGVVIIQVLKGQLQVTAEGQAHSLPAKSLLVLAPGVQHDVVAIEESEMLLTVNNKAPPS